jgi:hypothetical protein
MKATIDTLDKLPGVRVLTFSFGRDHETHAHWSCSGSSSGRSEVTLFLSDDDSILAMAEVIQAEARAIQTTRLRSVIAD